MCVCGDVWFIAAQLSQEPSVAGGQILSGVSQVYKFLDGTVSVCTQRISAESRKSLNK